MMFKCFVFLALMGLSSTGKLPSNLKRCLKNDPNFNECTSAAIQDAMGKLVRSIPEIGLPSVEPLEVTSMTIGAGTGPVAVQQRYKNLKVYGLSGTKISSTDMNFDQKYMIVNLLIPQLKVVADYSLSGKMLLLPIQGEGVSTVIMDNVASTLKLTFVEYEKNGKIHFKFITSKLTLDPQKMTYDFQNLFNGDKTLGTNINTLMNENWREVYEDIRQGYEEAYGLIIKGLINNVYQRVSVADLY